MKEYRFSIGVQNKYAPVGIKVLQVMLGRSTL